jgi:hypothetical protein
MKYVVAWEPRRNASEEALDRSLQIFGKWSPAEGSNFLEFFGRVDGRGGFALVETEDITSIARDVAVFNVFFDFNVYPVVDVQESARIALKRSTSVAVLADGGQVRRDMITQLPARRF